MSAPEPEVGARQVDAPWEAVIFDLDGVICHTDVYHYRGWKSVADELGIPFDEATNNRLRGVSRAESLEIVLERYSGEALSAEQKAELASRKNERYLTMLAELTPDQLDPTVRPTLDALRDQGLKLAIGSSSRNARYILDRIGLGEYFDAISDGTTISRSKPDPEVFLKAAEHVGAAPERCVVVEDATSGVDAAHAAGMWAVAIGDAAASGSGDARIDAFAELVQVLEERVGPGARRRPLDLDGPRRLDGSLGERGRAVSERRESETSGEQRLRDLLELMEQTSRDRRESIPPAHRYPEHAGIEVLDLVIPGPHGPVAARRYLGPTREGVGLVWVHGGAFISGDLNMAEAHWVGLALASEGVAVLSLDYQKALGGVHHPIPSDEILAGWLAATTDPEILGVTVDRLHLGGASAGACLSAGVALRLAAGAGPRPASLVLVYPLVHAELPEAQPPAAAAAGALPPELRFAPGFVRAVNVNYVGSPELLDDPVAFPANAGADVGELPPTLVVNAERDDLRASGEAFGAMLRSAGVPVRVEHEPGTVHGYLDRPEQPEATRTVARLSAWLKGASDA